jgi:hypothetical protein
MINCRLTIAIIVCIVITKNEIEKKKRLCFFASTPCQLGRNGWSCSGRHYSVFNPIPKFHEASCWWLENCHEYWKINVCTTCHYVAAIVSQTTSFTDRIIIEKSAKITVSANPDFFVTTPPTKRLN